MRLPVIRRPPLTKSRKRLTTQQRNMLLRVYLEQGYEASTKLADELGVLHGHAASLARKKGHYSKTRDGVMRRTYQCRKRAKKLWQRAVENGAINI